MNWKEKIEEMAKEVMKEIKRMGIPYKDCKEEVFEEALMHEFRLNGIPYERQRNIEIIYKGYSIGMRRPDCIINPGKREEEFLCEMKRVSEIKKDHIRQAEVYLFSLNIPEGCLLNFNPSTGSPEIKEVTKPPRNWKDEIVLPKKEKTKKQISEILLEAGKEVVNYLGMEFMYYKEPAEIYINAVGVELRLRGISFYSIEYPVLYKGQEVATYKYNYIFEDESAASIFVYKKTEDINEELEKLKIYNKIFGIKKGYILALPTKENMEVEVKEV